MLPNCQYATCEIVLKTESKNEANFTFATCNPEQTYALIIIIQCLKNRAVLMT